MKKKRSLKRKYSRKKDKSLIRKKSQRRKTQRKKNKSSHLRKTQRKKKGGRRMVGGSDDGGSEVSDYDSDTGSEDDERWQVMEALNEQNEELNEQNAVLKGQLDKAKEYFKKLEDEQKELQEGQTELQEELNDKLEEVDDLQENLDEAKQRGEEAEQTVTTLKESLEEEKYRTRELDKLKDRLEVLLSEKDSERDVWLAEEKLKWEENEKKFIRGEYEGEYEEEVRREIDEKHRGARQGSGAEVHTDDEEEDEYAVARLAEQQAARAETEKLRTDNETLTREKSSLTQQLKVKEQDATTKAESLKTLKGKLKTTEAKLKEAEIKEREGGIIYRGPRIQEMQAELEAEKGKLTDAQEINMSLQAQIGQMEREMSKMAKDMSCPQYDDGGLSDRLSDCLNKGTETAATITSKIDDRVAWVKEELEEERHRREARKERSTGHSSSPRDRFYSEREPQSVWSPGAPPAAPPVLWRPDLNKAYTRRRDASDSEGEEEEEDPIKHQLRKGFLSQAK